MGRPNEVSDAPVTPTTGGSWGPRSRARGPENRNRVGRGSGGEDAGGGSAGGGAGFGVDGSEEEAGSRRSGGAGKSGGTGKGGGAGKSGGARATVPNYADRAVPDRAAPDRAAPRAADATTRHTTAPDITAPDITVPDAAAPDAIAPGGALTGTAAPRAPEIARPGSPTARKRRAVRRGTADPVRSLMHHHRALCERAVDPLEIAAGLEARGLTDRGTARYRHRDVFSLAEELFARVPAAAQKPASAYHRAPERDVATRASWTLRALVPGAVCLAALVALKLTEGELGGQGRLVIALTGALLAIAGLVLALRDGPLHVPGGSAVATGAYGCWLLAHALYGDALLGRVLGGRPEGPWALTPAPLAGLALSVAPAAWCAHLFSVHARRRLVGSRTLEEFTAGVRPLLLGVVALHLCVLAALLYLARLGFGGGAFAGAASLGVLLLLARLLAVHGYAGRATAALGAACAVEALAPALVLAGRLPGLHGLARPVDALVAEAGTGAVPALACGAAALGLLVTGVAVLPRASAHAMDRPVDAARAAA